MERSQPVIPHINNQRCTGCGRCAELCPTHAVELRAQKAVIVRPLTCIYCPVCETFCPECAIERPFIIVFADTPMPQDTTQPSLDDH